MDTKKQNGIDSCYFVIGMFVCHYYVSFMIFRRCRIYICANIDCSTGALRLEDPG